MGGWKQRWQTLSSFLICAIVVLVATLLYPVIFLFFATFALVYPSHRRFGSPSAGGTRSVTPGEREGDA